MAKRPLPENIKTNMASYVACISGSIEVDEYKALLESAGLGSRSFSLTISTKSQVNIDFLLDLLFVDTKSDLSVYYQDDAATGTPGCCTPAPPGSKASKPDYDVNEWVGKLELYVPSWCCRNSMVLSASYQIYAIKDDKAADIPSTVLLRWWDAYPSVKSSPPSITAEEVASFIRGGALDFAVIDVRRNDHAVSLTSTICNVQTAYIEYF